MRARERGRCNSEPLAKLRAGSSPLCSAAEARRERERERERVSLVYFFRGIAGCTMYIDACERDW